MASDEKSPGVQFHPSTNTGSDHHGLHLTHAGRRIRHFFTPDGRKVHVAQSPDDAEAIRRRLSVGSQVESGEKSDSDGESGSKWDVVIHGDQEHVDLLRRTQTHHQQARDALHLKHGEEFVEFERVIRELDRLNNELHHISEHAVQLDANFDKYGFSAHIRTKESPNGSTADLRRGSDASSHRDWMAEKYRGQPMRFWQKPVIRQYFHKGLLWRAQEAQEVASYELFIDLFYVAIIAISGDNASEHPSGEAVLHFAITFILAWKFWSDICVGISWFDADDIFRRVCILFWLTCLLGFTTNINGAWEDTYTPLIAFYLASRFFLSIYFSWMAYLIPMVRAYLLTTAGIAFLTVPLWIGSIHTEEPGRQALIWPAIFIDLFGQAIFLFVQRHATRSSSSFGQWFKTTFEFSPGNNIEHRIERTNAFVALVFGYSVVGILYQSSVAFGINAFFGKAVLGLILAFSFNWLYFEVDTYNLHVHAIRRHMMSASIWMTVHLPFIMSYVLAAAALTKLVLAHDGADSDPHDLREPYDGRSEEHVSTALRWFFCAGIAIALSLTGIINLTHSFKKLPNQRVPKKFRLGLRFAVSLVILFLPLAHDSLDSLELVATVTCLVVLVLLVELIGASCSGDIFWGFTCKKGRTRRCHYEAKCSVSRRDVEESFRKDEVLNVEEVARKHGNDKEANEGLVI